jgi:DNA-directed RNA polymerase sigma subunit (sigma70/sigma32)
MPGFALPRARFRPRYPGGLTGRESAIIRGRYGIGGERRSLGDLAAELHLSRARVGPDRARGDVKLRESCDAPAAPLQAQTA